MIFEDTVDEVLVSGSDIFKTERHLFVCKDTQSVTKVVFSTSARSIKIW